jgi:hypothetical protein
MNDSKIFFDASPVGQLDKFQCFSLPKSQLRDLKGGDDQNQDSIGIVDLVDG